MYKKMSVQERINLAVNEILEALKTSGSTSLSSVVVVRTAQMFGLGEVHMARVIRQVAKKLRA